MLAACPSQSGPDVENPDPPPPFPTDFQPGPPLGDPDPAPPDKPGLVYLEKVHEQLGGSWTAFLENCRLRLPPSHALNNATLAARVSLVIARDGNLQAAEVISSSGNAEYDRVALDVVRDSAPFPEPPAESVSDDDAVHIEWMFARDRRQAGVATAELRRIEWEAPRAVPKFLAAGDVATAARRLSIAMSGGASGQEELYLGLGRQVAVAAVRAALGHEDTGVQRVGVAAAASAKLLAAAPELRKIIDTSVDVELRGEAIAAVGAIGDQGAGPLLVEVMETAKGSGVGGSADNSAAAAKALAAIGKGDVAEATVLGWLQASDPASQWAALVVMAEFSVPAAVPTLARLVADSKQPRTVRLAACTALGTSTTPEVGVLGMKALSRGLKASDAGLRAACTDGVARAAGNGTRSRLIYWALVKLLKKERDERVRAAAVTAIARLDSARFPKELYLLRKEKSKLVLAAMARALQGTNDQLAVGRLIALTRAGDPTVRQEAAMALVGRKDSASQGAVAALIEDPDPGVRRAAVAALDDLQLLGGLLDDSSPAVRSAAFASIVRVRGQLATLPQLTRVIAGAAPGSPDGALWAESWLGGQTR